MRAALLLGAAVLLSFAHEQPVRSQPSEPAPAEPLVVPGPPPGPAPAGAPSDNEETLLDETSPNAKPGGVAKPPPLEERFCTECLLIGAGVGVTIAGIPFIAISEIARNRKESLDAWVKVQGEEEDLGFAPGYGFAKADDEEDRYLVAGLVVTGLGLATLLTTVIVVASQGSGGGSLLLMDDQLTLTASPGGLTLGF